MTDIAPTKLGNKLSSVLAIGFIGLFLIGMLFPVEFWGSHQLYFLTFPQKLTLFLLAGAAFLFPAKSLNLASNGQPPTLLLSALGAGLFGIVTWYFPVAYDPYGDAVLFEKNLPKIALIGQKTWDILFGFSLDAWSGQKTMEAAVSVVSNYFRISIGQAFRLIDLVFGIAFSFVWIYFISRRVKNITLVVWLSVVGLTAPFLLSFFGRAEIYAPALFLFLVFGIANIVSLEQKSRKWVLILPIINLLCIKAHPIALLLVPNTIFLVAIKFRPQLLPKLGWVNITKYVFTPILIAGLFLYFLVFKDHLDDRSLQQASMQYDHLFLPLLSPQAPLNKYNLFSFNHIWDFFNVALIWSPAAIFILLSGLVLGKAKSFACQPETILIAVPVTLLSALLFAINPLLSMPMDWDLFSLPAPFILILAVLAVESIKPNSQARIIPPSLLIAILGSSFLWLHGSKPAISDRLESVAIHVHDSYYEWTMNIIERSDSIIQLTPQEIFDKHDSLVNVMRPNAVVGVDREYSELLRSQAKYWYRTKNRFDVATNVMKEAMLYDPTNGNNHITLMELSFLNGKMDDAFLYSTQLVELKHPTEEKAIKMAIHCALEADKFQEALRYSQLYSKKWSDPLVSEVQTRIMGANNLPQLKFLFSAPQLTHKTSY